MLLHKWQLMQFYYRREEKTVGQKEIITSKQTRTTNELNKRGAKDDRTSTANTVAR